jgi:hypothetical protein
MDLTWQRAAHLASDMFPIFRTRSRHNVVLCVVVVMVTVNENMEWRADRRYPVRPGHYRIPRWSTVALQAPHWVQSMERPCTWPCSARSQTDRLPHKWSIRLRAGDHNGRCIPTFSLPLAFTFVGASASRPFVECWHAYSRKHLYTAKARRFADGGVLHDAYSTRFHT